jgi:hypothetical protein
MLPHGFDSLESPSTADPPIELQLMARHNSDDRTAVGAPLLPSNVNVDDHDRPLHAPATGAGFIWALTCSAGLSGLLFGYEYEPRNPPLPSWFPLDSRR